MKDISKLKNYRQKYKRYYGIEFGKDFVVHHIDENRDNNDISNLLLLPNVLHSAYHTRKIEVETALTNGLCTQLTYSGIHKLRWQMSVIDNYYDVFAQVSDWVCLKFLVDNGCRSYLSVEGITKYGIQNKQDK